MKILIVIIAAVALSSCETFKDYDSNLVLVANVNEQTGAIEWKWMKAAVKGEGNFSGGIRIEGNLASEGKQVIKLGR